jgi:SnoaL-like domain
MKAIKITSLFLLISFGSFSQNMAHDTVEIRKVLTDFFEVFTNPDMKYFDRNCVPTFELYEVGEVWNKENIKNYVEKAQSNPKTWVRTNEFRFIKFNIRKKVAWASYHNIATITNLKDNAKREINWLESIILEKINGKWLLVQMHSTRKNNK